MSVPSLNTFLNAFNLLFKPDRLRGIPLHMQLEPCNMCNLRCAQCRWYEMPGPKRCLSLDEFDTIIAQAPTKALTFSGYGEPLLNPDLAEMIRRARSRGIMVNTTTNGLLLEEKAEPLAASGVNLVSVSLDAATPGTYLAIRRSDSFEKVLRGIRRFRSAASGRGVALRVNYVLQERNTGEVLDFLRLARSLDVDSVRFQYFSPALERREGAGSCPPPETRSILSAAGAEAGRLGLDTNLGTLRRDFDDLWRAMAHGEPGRRSCTIVWFSVYVTCTGEVWPCCQFGQDEDGPSLGNMLREPLKSILENEKARAFRSALRNGKRPHARCRHCVPITYRDLLLPDSRRF